MDVIPNILLNDVKVGDQLKWESHGGPSSLEKVGTVIMIVPSGMAGCEVARNHLKNFNEYDHSSLGYGPARDYMTYLLAVEQRTGRPKLYWPRATSLQLVEG